VTDYSLHREDMNDTSSTKIASIAERIESRLAAIGGHEAAIRADLAQLASIRTDEPSDALLDVDETCKHLQVSRATLFRLISSDPDLEVAQDR